MSKQLFSLITYKGLPNLDPDDVLLKGALERRGCAAQGLIWDDSSVDWSKAGVCIIRSTWDYNLSYEKFCAWVRHVGSVTTLLNPAPLVLWNSQKTYLKELAHAGLPVIPTEFISNESRPKLTDLLGKNSWEHAILKPTVGLATSGVKRVSNNAESIAAAEKHLDGLLENGAAMLQEFLPSVEGYGERALIFLEGRYSHCVRKRAFQPMAVAGGAGETAAVASDDELENAIQIMSYLKSAPLYARVDLVRDKANRPLLLELELVEPSLFIQTKKEVAENFADAILRHVMALAN